MTWAPLETAPRTGPILLFDPAEPKATFYAFREGRSRNDYEVRYGWEIREEVLNPIPPRPDDMTRPQWLPA